MIVSLAQAIRKRAQKGSIKGIHPCPTCKIPYENKTGKKRYCSAICWPRTERPCTHCTVVFLGAGKRDKFCSSTCQKSAARCKTVATRREAGGVECLVCGEHHLQLAFHLSSLHGLSTTQYLEKFPGALTISSSSSDKYREKWAGDKNPAVGSAGRQSPFSKKFSKYESLTEVEKAVAIQLAIEKYIKSTPRENRPMNVEYWVKRGMTFEEAKLQVSKRQTTFSLEKCIAKLGSEGLARWQVRQEKWHKNYKKSNYSQVSQRLFFSLLPTPVACFFAEHGGECVFKTMYGSVYKLDFWVPDTKHIIEFDGDYWNGIRNHVANKARDEKRDIEIKQTDPLIKILHIKEHDFNVDRAETIKKCKQFLIS